MSLRLLEGSCLRDKKKQVQWFVYYDTSRSTYFSCSVQENKKRANYKRVGTTDLYSNVSKLRPIRDGETELDMLGKLIATKLAKKDRMTWIQNIGCPNWLVVATDHNNQLPATGEITQHLGTIMKDTLLGGENGTSDYYWFIFYSKDDGYYYECTVTTDPYALFTPTTIELFDGIHEYTYSIKPLNGLLRLRESATGDHASDRTRLSTALGLITIKHQESSVDISWVHIQSLARREHEQLITLISEYLQSTDDSKKAPVRTIRPFGPTHDIAYEFSQECEAKYGNGDCFFSNDRCRWDNTNQTCNTADGGDVMGTMMTEDISAFSKKICAIINENADRVHIPTWICRQIATVDRFLSKIRTRRDHVWHTMSNGDTDGTVPYLLTTPTDGTADIEMMQLAVASKAEIAYLEVRIADVQKAQSSLLDYIVTIFDGQEPTHLVREKLIQIIRSYVTQPIGRPIDFSRIVGIFYFDDNYLETYLPGTSEDTQEAFFDLLNEEIMIDFASRNLVTHGDTLHFILENYAFLDETIERILEELDVVPRTLEW